MIEIIPNWHPIFVHFTIALLLTSAGLFFCGTLLRRYAWGHSLLRAAYLNLWIGTGLTALTVLAGWDAYNSVAHDGPSHAAMTDHRNWALATASLWLLLALWSTGTVQRTISVRWPFLTVIAIASALLAVTGFKGGEAVYRYGLGVMSLPQVEGDGDHGSHEHGPGADHSMEGMETMPSPHDEHGGHDHDDTQTPTKE